MLKPFARWATPRPMRPMPTIPSVASNTSWPSIMSIAQPRNRPERVKLSASTMRRAVAMSSVNAKSAVASSSTPGVFVIITLCAVAAGTSMLSKPTATLLTHLRPGDELFAVNSAREGLVLHLLAHGAGLDRAQRLVRFDQGASDDEAAHLIDCVERFARVGVARHVQVVGVRGDVLQHVLGPAFLAQHLHSARRMLLR